MRDAIYFSLRGTDGEAIDRCLEGHGWALHRADDVPAALGSVDEHRIRAGLLDLCPGDEAHCRCIDELLRSTPEVNWIGLIDPESVDLAVDRGMLPGHLFDYHSLPVDESRLHCVLGHAEGMARLLGTEAAPRKEVLNGHTMVWSSRHMQQVHRDIHKIAAVEAPVMILGESGTGKELAALAIHKHSGRGAGPFVSVNCAAIPAELVHSELFGHEKGAFTGAYRAHAGRIAAADGGTVFLDEIGDLTPDVQVNLLRFLQDGVVDRLGGSGPMKVDVRVIAATRVDLARAVAEGRFREDLFYRLNVLNLQLPPLRERKEDIDTLADFYFRRFAGEAGRRIHGFSESARRVMNAYHWPGNVRELTNRVRRAVVMSEGRMITAESLGLERRRNRLLRPLAEIRAAAEREAVTRTLKACRHNVSEAARCLGISRVTLYRMMDKYQLAEDLRASGTD